MRTITIGDLLHDEALDDLGHNLYIMRGPENAALYVGQSDWNVIERLCNHLGIGGGFNAWDADAVGAFVQDHRPESETWAVELRTFEECMPLITRHMPHCRVIEKCTLRDVERALMAEFRPRFNVVQNSSD